MNKTLAIGGAIVAAGGLLAAGWFGFGHTTSNARNNPPVAVSAPNVTLHTLSDTTIALSQFKGKEPVVIDFWATWCPSCQREMPLLNTLSQKYRGQVQFIGVDLQESAATVQRFVDSQHIAFPIVLDPNGAASNAFGVRYTNTHVLIGKDGNLFSTVPGDIQETDIAALIQQIGSPENQSYLPNPHEQCQVASAGNCNNPS